LASRDYAAFEVIVSALTDTPNGRLHKRLVESGKGTDVFGWASRNAEPGLLNLGVVLKKDDSLDDAQKILVDTIEGLAAEPITAEELKRTQLQWTKDLDKTLADPQRLCVTLSEAIGAGDWRLFFSLRDRVETITLAEINAAAKSWVKPSNRTLGRFIATDLPDRTPLAQRVDIAEALKDFKPKAALSAGETFDPSPANIEARTLRYTLASGLKVALLPKKSRGETVEVMLTLHFGNEQSLRGQRSAAGMVGAMLGTGTTAKSRAQISDAFDTLKTDWRVQGSSPWSALAGLNTRREHLIPALTLLAEVLREPSFPAPEFDQLVRQNLGALDHAADDPSTMATLALSRATSAFPQDDIRYVATIAENIAAMKALKLAEVAAFHRSHWGADHGELAIVGDFDAEQIKPVIAKAFGDWVSGQTYARVAQPPTELSALHLESRLADKPNAIALGSLPLKLIDTDADYTALKLAVHVLGAGGFDSRLLTRLRQKDGLSYGAGADLSASSFEPAGKIGLYAIFAPENRSRVEQGFAQELARFVSDGITEDELASAKKAIQAGSNNWRANDNSVAWAWAGKLERARTFQWDIEHDAELAALSVPRVNAAIRRWLDPARINWSLAGDLDKAR
jgi:zinc protease